MRDLALPLDSAHRVAKRSASKRQDLLEPSWLWLAITSLLSLQLKHLLPLLWQIPAIVDLDLLVELLKFGWNWQPEKPELLAAPSG